ncbi:MAG: hypothetical protein A2077_07250 [Nitrospirae bacterium GWC2_46_6]|nr:MAG: hypothetical protein A2077_07250 [Nitrospirae bacterium GWC2_46_6]OGW22274.1 MAG: hypothetical protein A2Z82_10125 [Nitrospirae bacterium GWA2_46_11]OGW23193.1 MAG: hypothetical protein A2X55_09480 [Nitrospirae bacterium GWB2_47_37]HCZ11439.1 hypothetical protein [Nitrospiraceae bacterium]
MLGNIKILIVDDAPPMRAFIKAGILSSISKDIFIDEAVSGEAAQSKLQLHNYDLILCDWNMPGMKGSDLLRWMKEQEDLKDTPFIMVTAHNEKDIIMDAVNLGITDFIVKPITVDMLAKKTASALRDIILKKRQNNNGEE